MIYGILFQLAVVFFTAYFIIWALSLFLPKRGLQPIFIMLSYPVILLGVISTILAMFDENLKLVTKFLFMAIAIVWLITGRVMEYTAGSKSQRITRTILQLLSLAGAWIIVDTFFLI